MVTELTFKMDTDCASHLFFQRDDAFGKVFLWRSAFSTGRFSDFSIKVFSRGHIGGAPLEHGVIVLMEGGE